MANKTEQPIRCSFCGRRENQTGRLIAGPGAYICSDCVDACKDLLREEYELDNALEAPEHLPCCPARWRSPLRGNGENFRIYKCVPVLHPE